MRLNVEVTNLSGGLLDQMANRVENPKPALRSIGEKFRSRQVDVFRTGGGGSWAPNDPRTARRKQDGRVLVDTGGLLRSLTQKGARYSVAQVTARDALFGTRNPVAHLQRDGARGLPKRNPVPPLTATEREQYAAGLLAFLLDGDA